MGIWEKQDKRVQPEQGQGDSDEILRILALLTPVTGSSFLPPHPEWLSSRGFLMEPGLGLYFLAHDSTQSVGTG